MAYCRSAVTIILLLAWIALPTLRCAVPSELTPQERACCKRMAGECGQMPSRHECCKKTVASPQNAMASPRSTTPTLDTGMGAILTAPVPTTLLQSITAALYGPSPPLLVNSTVLKI